MNHSSWEHIENEFTRLKETVIPQTKDLGKNTGVGGQRLTGGVPWQDLKSSAFELIEQGKIKVNYDGGIPRVDLLDLEQIHVSNA